MPKTKDNKCNIIPQLKLSHIAINKVNPSGFKVQWIVFASCKFNPSFVNKLFFLKIKLIFKSKYKVVKYRKT